MTPKNLIVEIYRANRTRSYILDKRPDGVLRELQRLAPNANHEQIIEELLRQRSDPSLYPNILLFLDASGMETDIPSYIDAYKTSKK